MGCSRSIQDERSIFVGTISGKSTSRRCCRSRSTVALAPETTAASWRSGVWSTGAAASRPWNVWPTTTTTIASFPSARIVGASFFTSADPNRFASLPAACFAPFTLASKYTSVRKKS